ncbi:MAG: alpha/beta hydrolase [Oceanicaulis sp.]|nr:alpha/beta hydrolase [Oceanicaulis sp.]
MTDPVRRSIALPGGEIAVLAWPAPERPRLLAAHGNGLNAMSLKAMLGPLAGRFDIVAADLRGHGRTTLPANPETHHSWETYARDLQQLMQTLDRPADLLAGHSMGAVSLLLAAGAMDDPPPLALIEPVVLAPYIYWAAHTPAWPVFRARIGLGDRARRRTNAWPSRKAALDRYSAKAPFDAWAPGVLEDYLEDGLTERADSWRLACDPAWEGANFEACRHDLMAAARRAGSRLHVLKAARGSTVINARGLERRGARISTLDAVSHLAPMEAPARCASWIADVARSEGVLD